MAAKTKKTSAKKGKKAKATKAKPKLAAKSASKAKAKAKAKPKAAVKAKAKTKPKAVAKPKAAAKPAKAKAGKAASSAGGPPSRAQLQTEVLAMARQLYGNQSDAELLAMDPNDIDAMDPSMFYELLQEKYGVESDPNNDYFGGFGGPISKTIDFIASQWDGKTKAETPMPPQDWLDEFVHPATAANVAAEPAASDDDGFAE